MKTAEEIITEQWKDYDLKAESFKNLAIKAMKIYANQKLDEASEIPPTDELDGEDQYDYSKGVTRIDCDYKQQILELKDEL